MRRARKVRVQGSRMTKAPAAVRVLCTSMVLALVLGGAGYPVGGSTPDRRPIGAPTMPGAAKDSIWFEHALRGVEAPYPPTLRFLEDQGAWYTPFTRPGMTGPYDLRRWHDNGTSAKGAQQ